MDAETSYTVQHINRLVDDIAREIARLETRIWDLELELRSIRRPIGEVSGPSVSHTVR